MRYRPFVLAVVAFVIAMVTVMIIFTLGGGPPAIVVAVIIVLLVRQGLVLLPTSFHSGVFHAQPTAAVYRGWLARMVDASGWAKGRTVEADAARLAAGIRLCTMSCRLQDGSQALGFLLLQGDPQGGVALAWGRRGRGQRAEPINDLTLRVHADRVQQNAFQARMGFSGSVEIGPNSYWLRSHDVALLQLVLVAQPEAAVSAQ